MPDLTPQQFVEKWERTQLKERASTQEHFADVCRLVGHPTPAEKDPTGEEFAYEYGVKKTGGAQGYADVWFKGHFAVEYKGKGKYDSLDDAYRQLQQYREHLLNPPLLVVCDIENWEIHTNWPNTQKKVYAFTNRDLLKPQVQGWLRALFFEPRLLHPDRTAEEVTADAADVFKQIAENMRAWEADPERIASFLTKLVFCLFAEDVGLLPPGPGGRGLFTEIIERARQRPAIFTRYLRELFEAMRDGGDMLMEAIHYFNGRLFDSVAVEDLSLEALTALERACHLDWSSVEPAIFGTLFERSLDPAKRAQLGAHYTSRDDILLIVEPVLMQPLRREWAAIQQEAASVRAAFETAPTRRTQTHRANDLLALRERMLARLRAVKVLDPACGSGNFLYVSLGLLLDLEKEVITHTLWQGLPLAFPEVHPRQLYGIEINPIAHDLASIVVWIGYIQWRQNNGYLAWQEPILEPLDNILKMDAILGLAEDGALYDPQWPEADVIVSNPPFLGDKKMRAELGDEYVDRLRELYHDRIPGQSDLVCYWFESAREMLENGEVKRVGLLATNSIRIGANREVLSRVKEVGDVFMAWSDRDWILDGAAVRVSMIGFDAGQEQDRYLDGNKVNLINSDLTATVDVTRAIVLKENQGISFIGTQRGGAFDISGEVARTLIDSNPINREVVRPWRNARDIVSRSRDMWIIYFREMTLEQASVYKEPLNYVIEHVKPERDKNRDKGSREYWWRFQRPRPAMYEAIKGLRRFVITPMTSKHRVFTWLDAEVVPENLLIVIARDDDYFFGILNSRLHEIWSLRAGTRLGKGNDPRYTPTTTFETFPFPWPPGQEDTAHPAYAAISTAAKQLHEERDAWLNPPLRSSPHSWGGGQVRGVPPPLVGGGQVGGKALERRTLTHLYNALNVWRGVESIKVSAEAADFAPRLDALHRALDRAVCDAYGWEHAILSDEEEILRRLLALNLARAS